ncbi:hypothetical protein JZ751_012392 [Albula glossodonta]|uniref:Complement component C9 n=1 Tax=Albula glossodonta TaxID=121402 RepID=A0A8T2PSH5_9TELE|nr:hypothetical protein JZ751_012392 [Albula glossodonta]
METTTVEISLMKMSVMKSHVDHAERMTWSYLKWPEGQDMGMDDDGALIHEVVASVRGGLPEAIAALKTKIENTGVMDVDTYVKWAKTLGNAPLLIHSQPEGIENLIPLTMANAEAKKENLRRAFQEYIAEYSVCKCQPCKNGGTVMMVNGECICLCPAQFKGWACEQLKDPMLTHYERTAVQEGNWGCWTSWSSCTEGRRSRTRSCNTNGLSGGTCKGSTTDSDYC